MADAFNVHYLEQLSCDSGSRVDETYPLRGNLLHHIQQERIVGATQHYGVRSPAEEGLETGPDRLFSLRTFRPSAFHQFHKALSDVLANGAVVFPVSLGFQILGCFQRACSGEDSYDAASGTQSRGLDSRFHADETDSRILRPEFGYGCSRGCVAGYDYDFGSLLQQGAGDDPATLPYEFGGLFPIGTERAVGKVDVLLPGKQPGGCGEYRETSQTGIENAYGCHMPKVGRH